MPSSTKWRMRALNAYGTGPLELSGVQFYAGATRVDDTATITSSLAPASGSLAALQDADTGTRCAFSRADYFAPGFYIEWTFGSTIEPTSMRVGSGPLQAEFLSHFDLQYWDGAAWVPAGTIGRFPWPGASALGANVSLDPNMVLASLLLSFNGTNGATIAGAIDTSGKGFTAPAGTAVYSTAESKFGGSSAYFQGGTYLQIGTMGAAPEALNLAASDFGIGMFVRFTSTAVIGNSPCLFACNDGPRLGGWGVYLTGGQVELFIEGNSSSQLMSLRSTTVLSTGVWYHIAVSREGDVFRVFVGGVLENSITQSGVTLTISPTGRPATMGGYFYSGSGPFGQVNGYVDELLLVKGRAPWTGSFTPPTAPYVPASAGGYLPIPYALTPIALGVLQGAYPPAATLAPVALRAGPALDCEFGGPGKVYGTTEVDGSPGFPKVCKVRLCREVDGYVVREMWSNAAGQWSFENLHMGYVYKVEAFDHTHDYRATIADNLMPELMA